MNDFVTEIQAGRRFPKDPFFDEGNSICRFGEIEPVFDIDDEELCHKTVPVFQCDVAGCNQTFTLVYEYEQHYNSVHRYMCKECRKTLPSPHLLDLHIMETHDTYFSVLSERKPMYQCFVEECTVKFSTPQQRRNHCIEVHKFPPDFRFDGSRKARGGKVKSKALHKKELQDKSEKVSTDMMLVEDNVGNDATPPNTKTHSTKIPKGFTFGHNQERTFLGGKSRGSKGKHWYQKKQPEKVTTQDLPNMGELMDSLPTDES